VAEKLGIHSVHASYCPIFLPSPHHRPHPLAPETRARARAVAGTIRTDGAMVAARLLVDAVSRERPPVSA
jgi:vancomycin aglycone glucosyltransferase